MKFTTEERDLILFCVRHTYDKLVAIDINIDDLKVKLEEADGDIDLHGDDLVNTSIALRVYCVHAQKRLQEMDMPSGGYDMWANVVDVLQSMVMRIDSSLQEEIRNI